MSSKFGREHNGGRTLDGRARAVLWSREEGARGRGACKERGELTGVVRPVVMKVVLVVIAVRLRWC